MSGLLPWVWSQTLLQRLYLGHLMQGATGPLCPFALLSCNHHGPIVLGAVHSKRQALLPKEYLISCVQHTAENSLP